MGAQELILSGQVHRTTGLFAALIVAFAANTVLTIGTGVGLSLFNGSWTAENAWLYGVAMGLFGFVWAATAMIVVQLVESARSTNGILAAVIGVAFILRGIGDFTSTANAQGLAEPSWWSWLSPFGWMQATRPLTAPEWWPLLVPAVATIIIVPLAFILHAKRDVGEGMLPSRKGKARASALLKTPLGLTWYLQKNIFIGWLVGAVAMAVTIGVLVPEMSNVYESNESMRTMIESIGGAGALIPSFLSAMLSIMALMAAAYAIQGIGKLRSEEYSGHLENILATKLSRVSWLSLHTTVVLAGSAVILVATGLIMALCVNIGSADYTVNLWTYAGAGLSYVPIVALFIGLYILLFGVFPRAAGLITWSYYGFVLFMTWLGPILKLNQHIMNLSVTEHIAAPPAESIALTPIAIFIVVAFIITTCGAVYWHQRNLLER